MVRVRVRASPNLQFFATFSDRENQQISENSVDTIRSSLSNRSLNAMNPVDDSMSIALSPGYIKIIFDSDFIMISAIKISDRKEL
jgi:hypothetical protein